jgi:DNA repair ATPase RecN
MLTRQEKERLVIDLYNQGKTIRDIAKDLRMSFRDIGAILKASREKEGEQDQKISSSPSARAYYLFSKSMTPLQVAIELDLAESETAKFYQEYLNLKQMDELRMVYEELGDDIMHFLKLYKLSKDAHMKPEHVVRLLQIANEYLPVLELKYKKLKKDIDSLEFEKQKLRGLGNHVGVLADVSEKYGKEIETLRKERTGLETLVKKFENSNEYKKIRQATEEEVTKALSNQKGLLRLAVSCVTEAMIRNPEKYDFFVKNGQYCSGHYAASQPNFTDVYRALILEDAEKLLEVMVNNLTSRIIV